MNRKDMLENMKKKYESSKSYNYRLICSNCLNREDVEIKYGVSVAEFRKTYKCKKCGVKQNSQISEAISYHD